MGHLYEPVRATIIFLNLYVSLTNKEGPSEITIFHPAAFEAMDGLKSNTTRSDRYDLLYPRISSVFTRDKALHDDRRRIWYHALSAKGEQITQPYN